MEIGQDVGGKSSEDGPVRGRRDQDRFWMARVCWPSPMVCRSGTALEAGIPKSAFAGLRDSFVFVRLPMND